MLLAVHARGSPRTQHEIFILCARVEFESRETRNSRLLRYLIISCFFNHHDTFSISVYTLYCEVTNEKRFQNRFMVFMVDCVLMRDDFVLLISHFSTLEAPWLLYVVYVVCWWALAEAKFLLSPHWTIETRPNRAFHTSLFPVHNKIS